MIRRSTVGVYWRNASRMYRRKVSSDSEYSSTTTAVSSKRTTATHPAQVHTLAWRAYDNQRKASPTAGRTYCLLHCSTTRAYNQGTIAHTFFCKLFCSSTPGLYYTVPSEARQSSSEVHPTLILLPAGETSSFERQTLFNNKYK